MSEVNSAPTGANPEISNHGAERNLTALGTAPLGQQYQLRHDEDGRPLLSVDGRLHVTHPDYLNTLPWIQRRRLTYDEFLARAVESGLLEPSVAAWADTFTLSMEEVREQMAWEELAYTRAVGDMSKLNSHVILAKYGDKPRVCWRRRDGLLGKMSHDEFKTAYGHLRLEITDADGEIKTVPMVSIWLRDRRTPRYEDAEFLPGRVPWEVPAGVYNVWAGHPEGLPRERDLRPHVVGDVISEDDKYDGPREPAECALFLHHLREHVCGGDEDLYHYVLCWMADGLVRPGLCETAIVLRGLSGVGKDTVAKLYGSLFGPHYIVVTDKRSLTGNFNAHLEIAQLVHAEEVDFGGEQEASKILRALVTEENWLIERKGIDRVARQKYCRFIITSNERHVVQAIEDDRRFLVLDVDAGEHNQDRGGYFSLLYDQWRRGGRVAFFRWLTGRYWRGQLETWNPRQRPVTAALQEQKELSLSPADQFLLGILEEGVLPGARPHNKNAPRATVLSRVEIGEGGIYQCMQASSPGLRTVSDQRLATALKQWGCTAWKSNGERGWTFPPLSEMRAAWCRRFGDRGWPDEIVDWHDQRVPF